MILFFVISSKYDLSLLDIFLLLIIPFIGVYFRCFFYLGLVFAFLSHLYQLFLNFFCYSFIYLISFILKDSDFFSCFNTLVIVLLNCH